MFLRSFTVHVFELPASAATQGYPSSPEFDRVPVRWSERVSAEEFGISILEAFSIDHCLPLPRLRIPTFSASGSFVGYLAASTTYVTFVSQMLDLATGVGMTFQDGAFVIAKDGNHQPPWILVDLHRDMTNLSRRELETLVMSGRIRLRRDVNSQQSRYQQLQRHLSDATSSLLGDQASQEVPVQKGSPKSCCRQEGQQLIWQALKETFLLLRRCRFRQETAVSLLDLSARYGIPLKRSDGYLSPDDGDPSGLAFLHCAAASWGLSSGKDLRTGGGSAAAPEDNGRASPALCAKSCSRTDALFRWYGPFAKTEVDQCMLKLFEGIALIDYHAESSSTSTSLKNLTVLPVPDPFFDLNRDPGHCFATLQDDERTMSVRVTCTKCFDPGKFPPSDVASRRKMVDHNFCRVQHIIDHVLSWKHQNEGRISKNASRFSAVTRDSREDARQPTIISAFGRKRDRVPAQAGEPAHGSTES